MDVNTQFWESILSSGCQLSIMVANSKFWVSILNSPSECLLFHSRLAGNRGSNWNSSSARNLSYFACEIEKYPLQLFTFVSFIKYIRNKKGGGKQVDNTLVFVILIVRSAGTITIFHDLKTDDG